MPISWSRSLPRIRTDLRRLLAPGRFVSILVCCCLCLQPGHFGIVSAPGSDSPRPAHTGSISTRPIGFARSLPRPAGSARVPLLADADAWKRMPATIQGGGGPLPSWARVLAGSLPRTTASMLELDYLHRARSPLDPFLRGRVRWVVARANGCRYGEVYAEADLRRAGVSELDLDHLLLSSANVTLAEHMVLDFARKLTLSAQDITDEEVAELVGLYGEKQVVALVLLVAYANFQDRLVLALDLPVEPEGPLAPLDVRFTPIPFGGDPPAPARSVPTDPPPTDDIPEVDPDWKDQSYTDLQKQMEKQQQRRARIRLPGGNAGTVRWGQVCRLYQPELSAAWSVCARSFGAEADQDPVFEESLFWVVTRSLQCFY